MYVFLKYKELQIIKHALLHYLNRRGATEKEMAEEERVLKKVFREVDYMKEKYRLK